MTDPGILYSIDGYYVTNEGTWKEPSYHVWIPCITHAECDSAYSDLSLAISRCDYLYAYGNRPFYSNKSI